MPRSEAIFEKRRRAVLRRSLLLLMAGMLTLALSACGGTAAGSVGAADGEAAPETVKENAESAAAEGSGTVHAAEMPRVVALSKSLGELWLLAGGELAGATEDAFELDAVSEETQVVGTVTKPNLEAILALTPDFVMISGELSAHREAGAQLVGAGVEVLDIDVNSFDDYDAVMRELTARTGRTDRYRDGVEAVRGRIGAVLADVPEDAAGTYLALRVSATKNKVLKSDNFACAMIDDLGRTNMADDDSSLDDLNLEAIVAADPDDIFIVLQGEEDEAQEAFQEAFASHPVWGELAAVRNGRVHILPKNYFQYKPNAEWDEAYRYLYDLLYAVK